MITGFLLQRKLTEESRMAVRAKLLRQILQMPGTFAKLKPAEDNPGFFVDTDSPMIGTAGIVVSLPVHPKSSVTLSRPLPPIPGVPSAVTTIPPVFMVCEMIKSKVRKLPTYIECTIGTFMGRETSTA
jgi:hypothetical protein